MGLRLVNLLPGSVSDYTKPGQPLQMGLKSDGVLAPPLGSVILGTFRASLGYTSIQNEGLLPENSVSLPRIGATIGLDTAEFIRPKGVEDVRTPFGTGIKMDAPGTPSPVGIYSVQIPVSKGTSVLGYFKFKSKTAWSLATRDWCNLTNMTGMYFGLEYGPSNTICWAGLRGTPGAGSLVIGGPMQTFNSARPGQQQFNSFNWLAQPNNTTLEMWIVFNHTGWPQPVSPADTPLLEIWTKIDGVDTVPVCQTLPAPWGIGSAFQQSLLGQFPSTLAQFTNFRPEPTDTATLYFGNVGGASDSLEMLDWALFPDYRVAVAEGQAVGQNTLTVMADSPYVYNCINGRPQDVYPGRWFPMQDSGYTPPSSELYFSPSRSKPSFVSHDKSLAGGSCFQRQEPRLAALDDGAVVEAFLSAELVSRPAESVGTGMLIDDGVNLYQAVMLESATRRTIGISKPGAVGNLASGYVTPPSTTDEHTDWRSLKLVRMVLDRIRNRLSLFVDGVRYIDIDTTVGPLLASTSPVGARIAFGHVEASLAKAKLNTAFLSYLTRYAAWEPDEQLLPSASPAVFVLSSSGTGFQTLDPTPPNATALQIGKSDFGVVNSRRYYSRTMPTVDERHGIQVDFKARVVGYTDRIGTAFARNVWVGSGAQVFLGNKRLHLGFFDCGLSGRFIGIIPGSGNQEDIINRTALGRSFSAPANWTSSTFYRLSYRPYDKIEVWVDNIPSGPVITIPWRNDTDGFDLPQDVTPAAVAFGHFDHDASSTTSWEFFRYGFSNGYEVSIEPRFDDGLKSYLYGGRSLLQTWFDE